MNHARVVDGREFASLSESVADKVTPRPLVVIALCLFGLQPLFQLHGWPLVAAPVALTVSIAAAFQQVRRGLPVLLPPPMFVLICVLGLTWAFFGSALTGLPLQRPAEWLSILLASSVGTVLLGGARGLATVRNSAVWGLGASLAAVATQILASPTMFGLLPGSGDTWITALHYNPNGGAAFIALCAAIVFASSGKSTRSSRIVGTTLVVAGLVSIVLIGSRGALTGLIAALLVTALLRSRLSTWDARVWLRRAMLAVLFATILFVILPGISARILDRQIAPDALTTDRGYIWAEAWDRISGDSPFGSFETNLVDQVDNAHNFLLEAGLRFGIVGLVMLVLLLCLLALRTARALNSSRSRDRGITAAAIMVGTIVYGLTHVIILDNAYFWIVMSGLVLTPLLAESSTAQGDK